MSIDSIDKLDMFDHVSPDEDHEVRTLKTSVKPIDCPICIIFERFDTWKHLVLAIKTLKMRARLAHKNIGNSDSKFVTNTESEQVVLKAVQFEHYGEEVHAFQQGQVIPKDSNISSLSPHLDDYGILRRGGRL